MAHVVNLEYQAGLEVMLLKIDRDLNEAYDLKNAEVASIRRDVDRHFRTVGALERRVLLAGSRRKVRLKP